MKTYSISANGGDPDRETQSDFGFTIYTGVTGATNLIVSVSNARIEKVSGSGTATVAYFGGGVSISYNSSNGVITGNFGTRNLDHCSAKMTGQVVFVYKE